MSIQGKNGTSRREVFSRELIVAFYFIFLVMTALCHKFGEVHIVHAFTRIVQIVYVPGIFFAVGYYIQIQSEKYGDFKGCMLRHAAYSLGLYALLGIPYEVFAKHVNPFTTIRNFITFIKVFEISAIFLSVSIVFLLCAYLREGIIQIEFRYIDTGVDLSVLRIHQKNRNSFCLFFFQKGLSDMVWQEH